MDTLAIGLRRKGVIVDAASAERWEEFLSGCTRNCAVGFKGGLVALAVGAIIVVLTRTLTLYFNDGRLSNVLFAVTTFAIGGAFVAFGAGLVLGASLHEHQIKRLNSKRFPPGDHFI